MKEFGQIQKIDINSSEYPDRLREIQSPPKQLYYVGDISLLHEDSVAVVGSRKYTLYGKVVATMIGGRLAEYGIPVTSGLAYGIDAFAHEGAVAANGRIIGVLASGIRKMGPRKNYELMLRGLAKGGLIISELEPDEDARKYSFPARNRIISGISKCVTVIEANFNSGALITAKMGLEQGRTVYAVPGNITSQFSMGSNLLIRDGALPLVSVDDMVQNLGFAVEKKSFLEMQLGEDEKLVYEALLRLNGSSPDRIAREIGRSAGFVNSIVTVLEVKGVLTTFGGKIFLAN